MLGFTYIIDAVLYASFPVQHNQVGGYWSSCYHCKANSNSNGSSKLLYSNEEDWLNFMEWFHTVEDDNGKI